MEGYTIRDCRGAEEYPEILRLLEKDFINGEPSITSLFEQNKDKITEDEKIGILEDLKTRYEVFLKNLLCRVVEHQGKIVGVTLMYLRNHPDVVSDAKSFNDIVGQLKIRSELLAEYIECVILGSQKEVDFFKIYPEVNTALELGIIAVEAEHRGKGLSTALIRDSVELAKSKGAELIYGQFTSPFSQKAARRIGFETYLIVDSSRLLDSKGDSFYKDESLFTIVEMYMLLRDV